MLPEGPGLEAVTEISLAELYYAVNSNKSGGIYTEPPIEAGPISDEK